MSISINELSSRDAAFLVIERSKGRTSSPEDDVSTIFPLYLPSVAIPNPL